MQEKFLLMANTTSHTKVQNKSRTNVQKQKRNYIFIHFLLYFHKNRTPFHNISPFQYAFGYELMTNYTKIIGRKKTFQHLACVSQKKAVPLQALFDIRCSGARASPPAKPYKVECYKLRVESWVRGRLARGRFGKNRGTMHRPRNS